VLSGATLVFVISLGFFITPALLGGGRVLMIGVLIERHVRQHLDWGLAAACAIIVLVAGARHLRRRAPPHPRGRAMVVSSISTLLSRSDRRVAAAGGGEVDGVARETLPTSPPSLALGLPLLSALARGQEG
jgi:ABC-type Fe3+ transport system permease subunit